MTKQERENDYRGPFKHPVWGRVLAVLMLLASPVLVPALSVAQMLYEGEIQWWFRNMIELIRWNDKDSTDD